MTHIEALAAIPAPEKAALLERSDRAGLTHLATHLGAIALTGLGIWYAVPLWWLLLPFHGVLIVFLFTLSHECTHFTPFKTKWINDAVGHGLALPLVLPFTWFRAFHMAHHKFTNDPERDPEIAGHGRPETWRDYLVYLSGWGYWTGNARTLWQNAFGTIDAPYLPPRQHETMRREARRLLALYAIMALSLFFSPAVFWVWLLPVLLGQPALRLYLLAEHGHCPPVADMLENTRTTFTTRFLRWLAWNMPYHAEHHAFPQVPFHQLPALHAHLAPHLKSVSPSYTEFSRAYVRGLEH